MNEIMTNRTEKETWTTWEELLLACAVKRHGLDWDSVATELRSRSSLSLPLTAQNCENKYHDLKRRFTDAPEDGEHDGTKTGDEVDSMPWLEELRKLRVAELKQEVHRCDLSIQSLQLKVKKLEEEREQTWNETEKGGERSDLEKNLKEDGSENGKSDGAGAPDKASPEPVYNAGKSVSSEDSDRVNRSFNESNSTENRVTGVKVETREPEQPVETGHHKPDPALSDSKPFGEDSYNDSTDTIAKHALPRPSQHKNFGDSAELQGLGFESKESTKECSDVQSSASLIRKRRRNRKTSGSRSAGDDPAVCPTATKLNSVKSELLIGLLDVIRSHKHGSLFERRLENQKTETYSNIVRRHVDLKTVETELEHGSYSSCPTKFYRDLLLLFNNAIVFFPKASSESEAAHQLRDIVLKEMRKERTQRSERSPELAPSTPLPLFQPKSEPVLSNSLGAKHKHNSSAPIVVCRKRSSVSAKATKTDKQGNEEAAPNSTHRSVKSPSIVNEDDHPTETKMKEKGLTGTRSLRKGNRRLANSTSTNHQVINSGSKTRAVDGRETSRSEKKRKDDVTESAKKRGAADFLKRIKKNSPTKGSLIESLKSPRNEGGGREQKSGQEGRKERALRRSGGGGGKRIKEESSSHKRSVGRPPKKGREAAPAKREAKAASGRAKKRRR